MSGFDCSIIHVEVAANGPACLEQIIKQMCTVSTFV